MDKTFFSSYRIDDRSLVAFIKREIHNILINAEFSLHKVGEIDIIISEITSNLIKYAERGELLYRLGNDEEGIYFEAACLDNGPGITNVGRMMLDGNTSSTSLGQGLGAINRLSDFFQIYSQRQWGCVQYIKIYRERRNDALNKVCPTSFGYMQVCAPGEHVCGDAFYIKKIPGGMQYLLADGLGHGIKANEAVTEAIEAFKNCKEKSPVDILRHIHRKVKKTRGLVATIASLDLQEKNWRICGIGNISTRLYSGLFSKNYTPYNGIIGHNIPRTINETVLTLEPHQTLIMHTDGLRTRWNFSDFPSLLKHDPRIIASTLYKDNARGNDDMTVLVQKINSLL